MNTLAALKSALRALGHQAESALVALSLVASAEAFDYRWPELYSGLPMMGRPSPYPAVGHAYDRAT